MEEDEATAKQEKEVKAQEQRDKEAAMTEQQKKDEAARLKQEEEQRRLDEKENTKAIQEVENTPQTSSSTQKTDWDGKEVTSNWYEKELFSIGTVSVTTGGIAIGSTVLITIGIIMGLIVCFFAYRERKNIATGARRLSDYVVRQSVKIRRSIKGKMGLEEEQEDDIDPEQVQKDFRGNNKQKTFLRDFL